MDSLLFGVITMMGISIISTGWRLKKIWQLRHTETPVVVKKDSTHQQSYCWQDFHPNRIGISMARLGVPVINDVEFSIERKSLLERGPLLATIRRITRLDLPSSCPMFDHFFKYHSNTRHLYRVLQSRPDVGQILVMQLGEGAIKGLSVRRLVCQRGILWIEIMMTRPISQRDLTLAREQMVERWVPTLALLSDTMKESGEQSQQQGAISIFKEKSIQASSLVAKRSLRWGRLFQSRQSVSLVAIMALIIAMAMSSSDTRAPAKPLNKLVDHSNSLPASEAYKEVRQIVAEF